MDKSNPLIGTWVSDPKDNKPGSQMTKLNFAEDGHLTFTIMDEEKDGIILLTYRIEGDILITDQPSNPREERTQFPITPEGKLVLKYESNTVQYIYVGNL